MKHHSLNLLVVLLLEVLLLVQHVASTSSDLIVRTLSGREIPLSAVHERIRKISADEASKRLFEVRGNILEGPGVRFNIFEDVKKTVQLPDLPSTEKSFPEARVTVNDRDASADLSPGYVKRGGKFRVVHMENGEIVAIFGKKLALTPLHIDNHPGVFLNAGNRQVEGDFEGDAVGDGEPDETSDESDEEENEAFDSHKGNNLAVPEDDDEELSTTRMSGKELGIISQPSTKIESWKECRKGNFIRLYEIAFASDNSLCRAYGNNPSRTKAAIEGMLDEANSPYRIQTCVYLYAKRIELNCNNPKDPYGAIRKLKTDDWLPYFGTYWNMYRKWVQRDVAVFLPGFVDGTTTLGVAFLGKTCVKNLAYAWVESLDDYVLAHELGHTLNCDHTQYGLMKAEKGWFDIKLFGSESLKTLYKFVDRKGQCLQAFGYKKKSCAASFDTEDAFICKKWNWGYVYNVNRKADKVNVFVEQVYDYFLITFQAAPGVKIKNIATAFVPYEWVFSSDLGPTKYFGNGVSTYSFKVKTSQVKYPYSTGTCCGNSLAVVVQIKFCRNNNCASGFHGFWEYVACGSCPKGKKLLPQTATRKCSLCV